MAGEEFANGGYGYACRIDNTKEAAKGNRVLSGLAVSAQGPAAMAVDFASGVVRINNAYRDVTSGSKSVTASDATNDRYDIIYVGEDGTVDYVAGTAAANPYPPDLPADHILLAMLFVENNSTTVEAGDISDARIIHSDAGVQVPVGAILPWAKSISGVPSLPDGFVECNGQTLTDAESPLDGQVIPDLNGSNQAIRGNSTSGGTADHTHTYTEDYLPSHQHGATGVDYTTGIGSYQGDSGGSVNSSFTTSVSAGTAAGTTAAQNTGQFYNVVFIMRIK